MPATSPHPIVEPTLGILNLGPTLRLVPAGANRNSHANLPPLSFLLPADRLAELYEMVFPDHPEWLEQETVDWEGEEAVAAAVERFLNRVNALFPVHDELWETDLAVVEWRLYEIPVMPLGYDIYTDDWESLKEPAPYLLHMRHSRGDEDSAFMGDAFADLYPEHQTPRYLEPQRLVAGLCRAEMPYPELAALPDLIQMLEQSTGNAWLDVGEMSLAEGGYPEWSRENVEWLAEAWRQARPVLERIMDLLNWKNDSPEAVAEKVTAVRDVLLEAYARMQQDEPANTANPAPAA